MGISHSLSPPPKAEARQSSPGCESSREQRAVWSARWHEQINPSSDTQLPGDSMSCLRQSVRGSQALAYSTLVPRPQEASLLSSYAGIESGDMAPCLLSESYFQITFSSFYSKASYWLALLEAQLETQFVFRSRFTKETAKHYFLWTLCGPKSHTNQDPSASQVFSHLDENYIFPSKQRRKAQCYRHHQVLNFAS